MTAQRRGERRLVTICTVPAEIVASVIALEERRAGGLWCLVAGALAFVPAAGASTAIEWDNALRYSRFVEWVRTQPERVHPRRKAAVAFVRSRLGG